MVYVLIPGAGERAWYWHLIAARLSVRGHHVITVELPADDDSKGLPDYAQAVLDAVGDSSGVVVVAASLGAFTPALVVEPLEAGAVVCQPDDPAFRRDARCMVGQHRRCRSAQRSRGAVWLPCRLRPEDLHGARQGADSTMTIAVSVDDRNSARTIAQLQMWCNSDDLPEPEGVDPMGAEVYLELESCRFRGEVHPVVRDREAVDHVTIPPAVVDIEGRMLITLGMGRMLCLFHPEDALEPTIWFCLPAELASSTVRCSDKRVSLQHRGLSFEGEGLVQHLRGSGEQRWLDEEALVNALARQKKLGVVDLEVQTEVLPTEALGEWEFDEALDCYLEFLDGRRTGRVAVTDPTSSRRQRTAQLTSATWMPELALDSELNRVFRGRRPSASTGQLPATLGSPVPLPALAVQLWGSEPRHPVADHLWPRVTPDGVPVLEDGERVLTHWIAKAPTGGFMRDDPLMPSGISPVLGSEKGPAAWTLTNQRLIVVCRPAEPIVNTSLEVTRQDLTKLGYLSPTLDTLWAVAKAYRRQASNIREAQQRAEATPAPVLWWAMHVRVEWVRRVYSEDVTLPGNKPLFGAPTPPRTRRHTTVGFGDVSEVLDVSIASETDDDIASKIRDDVLSWIRQANLSLGDPIQRSRDNGRHGHLVVQHLPVQKGTGVGIPARVASPSR